MALSVPCEIYLFISTLFHVVPPMFDPAHYWGPYLGLQGPPVAGGSRQTSISHYGRLHTICSCTQMLVSSSFDQNALGCCSISRGKIIQRLFEFREELSMFLCNYNTELASIMTYKIWLCTFAYLADIFNKLNELNLSLQGRNSNILFSHDKIEAFKKKIKHVDYKS